MTDIDRTQQVPTVPCCDKHEATLTWVCVCCLMRLANDDVTGCENSCAPDHAPSLLTSYPGDADLTIGMLIEEHPPECENRQAAEAGIANEVECECETITFSKSWCDGCGSPLAGERHAVTMWTRVSS